MCQRDMYQDVCSILCVGLLGLGLGKGARYSHRGVGGCIFNGQKVCRNAVFVCSPGPGVIDNVLTGGFCLTMLSFLPVVKPPCDFIAFAVEKTDSSEARFLPHSVF